MLYHRAFERTQLQEFLRVYDLRSMEIVGYVADISLDGIQLVGKDPFEIDQLYQFYIELPAEQIGGEPQLEVAANIIWRKEDRIPNYFDAGFQFLGLEWESKKSIDFLTHHYAADDQYLMMQ